MFDGYTKVLSQVVPCAAVVLCEFLLQQQSTSLNIGNIPENEHQESRNM